jgi:3-oxoacyl-[acyl-carrier-protein] synthase-1
LQCGIAFPKELNRMNLYIKKHIKLSFKNSAEIAECYRSLQVDYPKFFKMDGLSKLGFLASEMIFKDDENRFSPSENIAIIGFNRSSSLDIDTQYQATIADNDNYFPSPSLFVYTLPNIVTGEIAIRNCFFGETFFYICKEFDAKQFVKTVKNAFFDTSTTAVLATWIEHFEEKSEVFMVLVEGGIGDVEFTEEQLSFLYFT